MTMDEEKKFLIVDANTKKSEGKDGVIYTRVCNDMKCELLPVISDTLESTLQTKKLRISGLATTQRPREYVYITDKTMERDAKTLIGKPISDTHGMFPWDAIRPSEIIGVVTNAWFDKDREAIMFEGEIWDENAIEVIKKDIAKTFSVGFWLDGKDGKIIDEYDEEIEVFMITEIYFDHLAFLLNPQVPEAEIEDMEEFSAPMIQSGKSMILVKTYSHNSRTKKGETAWGNVDKTRLPYNAFANMKDSVFDKKKKSTWKFPHHWISMGKMYLHRGGLSYAIGAANGGRSGKKASKNVFAHLNSHLKALGVKESELEQLNELTDVNEIENILAKYMDEVDSMKEETETLSEDSEKELEDEIEDTRDEELGNDDVEEKVSEEEADDSTETESEETETEAPEDPENDSVEGSEQENEASEETSVQGTGAVEEKQEIESPETENMSVRMKSLENENLKLSEELDSIKSILKEKDINAKVDEFLRNGKILPSQKDDVTSLLMSMSDDQISLYEKALSESSVLPDGEKSISYKEEEAEAEKEDGKEKPFIN
jgi:hypothetical protein